MMCSASTIAAAFFEYLPDPGERAKAIQLAMCRKLHSMDSFEDACKNIKKSSSSVEIA